MFIIALYLFNLKKVKTIEYTYSLDQIDAVAKQVLGLLTTKSVLFNGDMGSGKTTFINALLKVMDSKDVATSPTFSIVNEYDLPNDKVYHFDFYRIESIDEAYNFGIEDYLNSNNWLFMEWPERISSILPENNTEITISILDSQKRTLKLTISNSKSIEYMQNTV
jgi:tRNA threonylcarbamoyladenosine biosynthesis protein TsaE